MDGVCLLRPEGTKEEKKHVKKNVSSYVWKKKFMEKMCANKKHGRKLCIANNYSGVHGRISMNKPMDSDLNSWFPQIHRWIYLKF